jgi:hypothetical protein
VPGTKLGAINSKTKALHRTKGLSVINKAYFNSTVPVSGFYPLLPQRRVYGRTTLIYLTNCYFLQLVEEEKAIYQMKKYPKYSLITGGKFNNFILNYLKFYHLFSYCQVLVNSTANNIQR